MIDLLSVIIGPIISLFYLFPLEQNQLIKKERKPGGGVAIMVRELKNDCPFQAEKRDIIFSSLLLFFPILFYVVGILAYLFFGVCQLLGC